MENELSESITKYKRIMLKLTSDPKIFEDLVDAFYRLDGSRYRGIIDKLDIDRGDCSLVCGYICYPVLIEIGDKLKVGIKEECEKRCKLVCGGPLPDYKG